MATRMQQRRGTEAQWTSANPVLAAGEIGFEIDTNKFKIGDGINQWDDLSYFLDTSDLDLSGALNDYIPLTQKAANNGVATLNSNGQIPLSQLGLIIGGAPEALDTLQELAAALEDDENFASTVTTALGNKQDKVANVSDTEIGYLNGVTGDIQEQLDLRALTNSPTFFGEVVLPTTTSVGDVTSLEIGYLNGVTSGIQDQLDNKANDATVSTTYAPLAGPTFTGNVVLPGTTSIGNVDSTELGHLNGVTSAVQTQLDAKAPTANPTFTGTVAGVTKAHVGLGNVDNTSDVDKPVSTATQTALDLKANLQAPTFTGTVVLPSTTSVGDVSATELGYVNGVTSAIQTQLDAKASLAGAIFTGNVEVDGNLVVDGDFTVNGTNFNASATSIVIEDNMLQLAHNQAGNTVDLGLVVAYNDGTYRHAGIVRDVSESKWKLFKNVATDPTTTVDFASGALDDLQVAAFEATSATIGDVSNTELQYLNGVTSAIQTQINSKSPIANPTFTGTVTVAASGVAFTDGTQTKQGVPSITTISAKTDSYTLSNLNERDTIVEISKASATTLTIPTNSSVAYPVGTTLDIIQTGSGQVTIAGAGGVTVNATPGLKLRTQWSSATLLKRAENTWLVYGDLTA
jgi:hypothetical protein